MRSLTTTFKEEKNKAANKPVFLYTIFAYDGTNNLYLAGYDIDIVFDGITYQKFPITHEFISENSTGQIDEVKVKVSNVNRVIQYYLEQNSFKGKKVSITTVFSNLLSSSSYKIVDTFYIDSYIADQNMVEFTLSSKFDILEAQIPQGKYMRGFCRWKFKSTECGYTGPETTCNKLKSDCDLVKNNFRRFGGFPSIPAQRTYVQ